MTHDGFRITVGPGPIVAAAVHDGHDVHPETLPHMALPDAGRLREEDPFTGKLTDVAPTRVVGERSRFEVDLNRPPEGALYRTPDDAWGLTVWHGAVPDAVAERSTRLYDRFYAAVGDVLDEKVRAHGSVVVLDLHSYNHMRDGADGAPADPEKNPEVNVGTGPVDRERWGALIDRFMADLRQGAADAGLPGLDVRENVKFKGGHFSRWISARYGSDACVIAVEFKKTFMDEWTGAPDRAHLGRLHRALAATVSGLEAERVVAETRA